MAMPPDPHQNAIVEPRRSPRSERRRSSSPSTFRPRCDNHGTEKNLGPGTGVPKRHVSASHPDPCRTDAPSGINRPGDGAGIQPPDRPPSPRRPSRPAPLRRDLSCAEAEAHPVARRRHIPQGWVSPARPPRADPPGRHLYRGRTTYQHHRVAVWGVSGGKPRHHRGSVPRHSRQVSKVPRSQPRAAEILRRVIVYRRRIVSVQLGCAPP